MKPLGWLVVLVLLMLTGRISLQTSRDPKQELLGLESHWLSVEDDPVTLEAILASDFLHVVPAGIITKDEQLGFMRSHPAPPQGPEKHFEDMHVRIYGDARGRSDSRYSAMGHTLTSVMIRKLRKCR